MALPVQRALCGPIGRSRRLTQKETAASLPIIYGMPDGIPTCFAEITPPIRLVPPMINR